MVEKWKFLTIECAISVLTVDHNIFHFSKDLTDCHSSLYSKYARYVKCIHMSEVEKKRGTWTRYEGETSDRELHIQAKKS